MSEKRKTLATYCAAVLVGAGVSLLATEALEVDVTPKTSEVYVGCQSMTWGAGAQADLWDARLEAGWLGDPNDGTDQVIFSPECRG